MPGILPSATGPGYDVYGPDDHLLGTFASYDEALVAYTADDPAHRQWLGLPDPPPPNSPPVPPTDP